MIVVDSSVWIEYLRAPDSQHGRALDSLLERKEALLTGVVIAEVVQGLRADRQRTTVADYLVRLPYSDLSKDGWLQVGELAYKMRRQGQTPGLADLAIAAVAIEGGHELYTLDADFQRIPGVKLHQPQAGPQ